MGLRIPRLSTTSPRTRSNEAKARTKVLLLIELYLTLALSMLTVGTFGHAVPQAPIVIRADKTTKTAEFILINVLILR